MKNTRIIIIFIVFTLIVSDIKAQDFAPIGAVWHYNVLESPGIEWSAIIISEKDTSINGKICKQMGGGVPCSLLQGKSFVYEEDSIVYWYNDSLDRFGILYSFKADINDSWYVIPTYPSDSFQVRVDSIKIIEINGLSKKQFFTTVQYQDDNPWYLGSYIQDIGSTDALYPIYGHCDPVPTGLRCYEDNVIGLFIYDSQFVDGKCDSTIVLSSTNAQEADSNVVIYPTITNDEISIRLNINEVGAKFFVYDLHGKLIKSKVLNNTLSTLSLSNEINGIYLIRIETKTKIHISKIMKL